MRLLLLREKKFKHPPPRPPVALPSLLLDMSAVTRTGRCFVVPAKTAASARSAVFKLRLGYVHQRQVDTHSRHGLASLLFHAFVHFAQHMFPDLKTTSSQGAFFFLYCTSLFGKGFMQCRVVYLLRQSQFGENRQNCLRADKRFVPVFALACVVCILYIPGHLLLAAL